MKVRDLINELVGIDPDREVHVVSDCCGCYCDFAAVDASEDGAVQVLGGKYEGFDEREPAPVLPRRTIAEQSRIFAAELTR